MDRIWQWAWDRHKPRYSWTVCVIATVFSLPVYIFWSCLIVAVEGSSAFLEAAAITIAALPVVAYVNILPGVRPIRLVDQWAAGHEVDRVKALDATYAWIRAAIVRIVMWTGIWVCLLSVGVGMIAGATGWRLFQYGILGFAIGGALGVNAAHSYAEPAVRPARIAIAGDTEVGDSLPRSRPTFAVWSNLFVLLSMFVFAVDAAMLAAVFGQAPAEPVLFLAIGCGMTLLLGVPITVAGGFSLYLQPIRDLAAGTERVAAGNYGQRVPVVQDDDLGVLSASFNRMQAGLAERQRLQVAFGTYVDPVLASRLLEQGDDVFTGERREVTVMFVDIRDFTPFAEANSAEDTVARLNAVFDIVVPTVVDAGGHVNKFLGDGALAVFGAPNELAHHADAAVRAAVLIQRLVTERFVGELRIGIGINTGPVIAGTIGGGSKLEFTLIGDTVNVAARVEQLTKNIGGTILLTQQTVDALPSPPADLVDSGCHALKGKSDAVQIYSIQSATSSPR